MWVCWHGPAYRGPAAGPLPLAGSSCEAAAAKGEGASASMACAAARAPGGSGGGEVGSRGDAALDGAPADDAPPSVRAETGADPAGLTPDAPNGAAPAAPGACSSATAATAAAAASAAAASGGSCSRAIVWEPLRPQLPVLLNPLTPLFTLPDAPAAPAAPTGTPSPGCCAAAAPTAAAAADEGPLMLLCRLLLRLLFTSSERSASVQANDTSGTAAQHEWVGRIERGERRCRAGRDEKGARIDADAGARSPLASSSAHGSAQPKPHQLKRRFCRHTAIAGLRVPQAACCPFPT